MSGIFISYRRDDSEGQAGRLFEGLTARFGQDRVFIDVAGIEPGRDFRRVIDEHVSSCDVLLALIGRNWLHAADKDGRRRLDTPEDFVRLEIAAALRRDIAVIPVLVQGAAMPSKEELPPDLQALAWRNAAELRHTRWDADFAELAATLQSHSGYIGLSEADPPKRLSRWRWSVLAALSLAVLAIAATVMLRLDNVEMPKLWDARTSPSSGAAGVVEAAPIPAIGLDGRWKGTVTYDWGPTFDETFTFRLVGGTVAGSAGFFGHGRTILEGSLEGRSLRFVTKRATMAGGDHVAAKHGMLGLTKVTALETAEQGITCNAICPGYVWTPLVAKQIDDQARAHGIPRDEVTRDVILAPQPTKQFVAVEEVAALTVFLASDAARSITGAALPIEGGWTAR